MKLRGAAPSSDDTFSKTVLMVLVAMICAAAKEVARDVTARCSQDAGVRARKSLSTTPRQTNQIVLAVLGEVKDSRER